MHIAIISDRKESSQNNGIIAVNGRLWKLGERLRSARLRVTHLVVHSTNPKNQTNHEYSNVKYLLKEDFSKQFNSMGVDAVIVRSIHLIELVPKKSIPVIIDLSAEIMNIAHIHSDLSSQIRIISELRKGDFFICSSEQEKWFFMSWLQQTGFRLSADLIHVISDFALCGRDVLQKQKKLTFAAYKSVGKTDDVYGLAAFIDALHGVDAQLHFIQDCTDKTNGISKASVGVVLSETTIESQMAIPLEAVSFLCAGLPVICSKGTACGRFVEKYNAGWTVDVNVANDIAQLLKKLEDSPQIIETARKNACKVARERYKDTNGFDALISFCRKPVKYTDKRDGLLSNLIDYSEKALNLNNPLLNDLYIEEIIVFHSSSWEHLDKCLEAIDILFPMSNVTVLCPINTLVEEPLIAPHCTLIIYEGDIFEPQMVVDALAESSDTRYDLGIALFNNRFGEGYEPVKKSLLASGAKYKVGFSIDEKFIMLEDSIEKAISDIFDNVAEIQGFNNSL
ncbi:glycosyltransferase [bacterium]|nr:glycosyltransferase [bacterium]